MDVSSSPCDNKNVGSYIVKNKKKIVLKTRLKHLYSFSGVYDMYSYLQQHTRTQINCF